MSETKQAETRAEQLSREEEFAQTPQGRMLTLAMRDVLHELGQDDPKDQETCSHCNLAYGYIVQLAAGKAMERVRQQTAKEIAQKLLESGKAMRAEYDYSGAEALEDAAKLIEREYEVSL